MSNRFILINEVSKLSGSIFKKKDVQICLALIIEFILKELKKDRSVSINNFGTFAPVFTKPHIARDLLTKKLLPIESFRSIKFYPSRVLFDAIKLLNNNLKGEKWILS